MANSRPRIISESEYDCFDDKKCSNCGLVKPPRDFCILRTPKKKYLQNQCRSCVTGKVSLRYRRDPAFRRYMAEASIIHNIPALRRGDIDRMLISQCGKCAICGLDFSPSRPSNVDHCHETGAVRELLCAPCNSAIGMLGDDPDRAVAASEYLKRHSKCAQ